MIKASESYRPTMECMGLTGSGGGSSESQATTPVEAPNTLQSVVKGRIVDLIAYGPVKGLKDGLKSVYLDDTPIMNADGSYNFQGITVDTREGYPNQGYMPGFPAVENSIEIGTEVLFDNPPVRSVTNNDADAVLITIQLAALVQQSDKGGSIPASVTVLIDYRQGSGAWINAVADTINGKTTSPYPRTYRVELEGEGPFDIRVRRANKESTDTKYQDKVTWTLINEIIDAKMSHPNMAMVGITVDSKLFGTTMPSRSYDYLLSIISVPSNYDPYTRTYTGIWDGTFKQEWTDNPAWCYYDLATHPVIGGGLKDVDKWWLYKIGQYCDELVPDGYGGMEPRFSCNTLFADQEDATTALNTFASCFRGMAYWGTNTMVPVADMPGPIRKIASPANVQDGDFEYIGTSIRERHSVCTVMWNDLSDGGKAVPEVYEDPVSIVDFGWVETRVTAVACTSRGQARRLAKWILYSERMETQTLNYTATMDHADLRPGDLIEVADPYYQGARMAGRVVEPGTIRLVLDQVPARSVLDITGEWYISVLMPTGEIARAKVSSFQADNVVNLQTSLPYAPEAGFMWALHSTSLELPQFRIVSNVEDGNSYKITATEYDPRKYDIVERDLVLPDRPTSLLPTGQIAPPLDLSFQAYKYLAGGSEHQGLVISWTPSDDVRVDSYMLDVMDASSVSFRTVYNGAGLSYDLRDAAGGTWTIRVRAIAQGIPSQWVSRTVQIATLLLPVAPDSVEVQEGTFSITLSPRSAYPDQMWEFWRSLTALTLEQIEGSATQLPTGTYLVDTHLRANRAYFYWVRGVNQYGKSTWYAVQAKTLNDFEDIINQVKEEIVNGELYQVINERIVLTSTDTAERVVNEALEGIQDQIDNLIDALAYSPNDPYVKNDVVRSGKKLYQAKGPVPANADGSNGPPNTTYWEPVADILEDANAVVLQVQQLTSDVTELDGLVTATGSSLQVVQASLRDEDDGEQNLFDAVVSYDSNGRFVESVKVVTEANKATVTRVETLTSTVAANKAEVVTLTSTVTTLSESTATRIETLTAGYNENKTAIGTVNGELVKTNQAVVSANAAIVAEQIARANAVEALASSVTTLTAGYNENKAAINGVNGELVKTNAALQSEGSVRASADQAITTSVNTLTSTVNGHTSSIQTVATTVANNKNEMKALYAIKLQLTADGRTYAAGMGLDLTTAGGITQSSILFQADRIAMINVESGNVTLPFLMEGGTVYINNAMLKAASINFAQISDSLQSSDFVDSTSGWRLPKAGPWQLNGSVGDGRRSSFSNAAIRMYHANGVLGIDLSL